MNKLLVSLIGSAALLLQTASAQTISLFTTSNDFAGWSGSGPLISSPTTITDLDNVTINGLGDGGAAGATGTPGALAVAWASGAFDYVFSQGESGNPAFISAIEAATNPTLLTLKYTTPAAGTASYYQIGLAFNFTGNFFNVSPKSATTVAGVTTATFDITAPAQALYAQDLANGGGGIGYLQIGFYYNSNYTPTNDFYVDAISLTNTIAPPPPVMSIASASPGLTLFASVPGNTGSRQSIETVNSYPWVGEPGTTIYSIDIADFPGTNHSDFQAQIFLVGDMPGTESAPDYNETNVIFLQIVNNVAGGATAILTYKTNAPDSYPFFSSGVLATIESSQVTGPWTLVFQNNTNVTLSTPGNTSTNFAISPDIANQFASTLYAYFGIQPNTTNNIGQSAIFSSVQISNAAVDIDEQFTNATLDPTIWQITALDPNGVIVAPPGSAFWLSWTQPDTGFTLQATPSLTNPLWADSGLTSYPGDDRTRVVVPANSLPSSSQGFYELIKP